MIGSESKLLFKSVIKMFPLEIIWLFIKIVFIEEVLLVYSSVMKRISSLAIQKIINIIIFNSCNMAFSRNNSEQRLNEWLH